MKNTAGAKSLLLLLQFHLLICLELTKEKKKQKDSIPTLI